MAKNSKKEQIYFSTFVKIVSKKYFKFIKLLENEIWPMTFGSYVFIFICWLTVILGQPNNFKNSKFWIWFQNFGLGKSYPRWFSGLLTSIFFSIITLYITCRARQLILRRILNYRQWLYGIRKGPGIVSWGILLKLFTSSEKPQGIYLGQKIMPKLSVPNLKGTLEKLIESLRPFKTPQEILKIQIEAQDFQKIAWKLQIILKIKSWLKPNYVTDWWEKYIYLKNRAPLAVNSNYFGAAQSYWSPTTKQSVRASVLVHLSMLAKGLIDSQNFPPLMINKMIPVCMSQYKRIFSSTRIPGQDIDHMVSKEGSQHIIVNYKGFLFKVHLYNSAHELLTPIEIQHQIENIYKQVTELDSKSVECSLSALTALPRDKWADIRAKYFTSSKINRESLKAIEDSIYVLVLTHEKPQNLVEKAQMLMHSDGKSIFYDKCFNMLISSDGKSTGFNLEHTYADAPPICHVWEWAITKENTEKWYTEDGECMPVLSDNKIKGEFQLPEKLLWDINEDLGGQIESAVVFSQSLGADLDIEVFDHDEWGKGRMKRCGVSPDAFIQIALQLAYWRDSDGKFVQTYEPTMLRLFLEGRTETVRVLTQEIVNFVKSMALENVDRDEKIRLFKLAAGKHQENYRDCMNGKGVDRHLFALYIAAKGFGYETPFLDNIMSIPWTLTTSQSPQHQLEVVPDLNHPYYIDRISSGGGFSPVDPEGYGVGYMIMDCKIFFHITSKHSCRKTDSKRFMKNICESMRDIIELFIEE